MLARNILNYDGVGNRLMRVIGGTTETYAYSTAANQVTTITTSSNTRSFSYLASGQVSQDVRDSADTYTFAANNNGRNASAALNGTTAGAYLYNAFEQRVQKTVGSAVTQFVFDRFGHLLAEANGSGAAQKEYIWLDDMPVAPVDDTGAAPVLYYIHTDQLGSPQKLTGPGGSIVWDGGFDPFANPQFTSGGGVWGTSVWGSFTWGADLSLANLRFPGQYADAETALNQNWFRDYDPTIGRYVQSDPIGLLGGADTYPYVGANPLANTDPWGLIRQLDPDSDECQALARRIDNIRRDIERNENNISMNSRELPLFGPGPNRATVYGHTLLGDFYKRNLRNAIQLYKDKCGCDPPGTATAPVTPPIPSPGQRAPDSDTMVRDMTAAAYVLSILAILGLAF